MIASPLADDPLTPATGDLTTGATGVLSFPDDRPAIAADPPVTAANTPAATTNRAHLEGIFPRPNIPATPPHQTD